MVLLPLLLPPIVIFDVIIMFHKSEKRAVFFCFVLFFVFISFRKVTSIFLQAVQQSLIVSKTMNCERQKLTEGDK